MRRLFLLLGILLATGAGTLRHSQAHGGQQCSVAIETPQHGERVGGSGNVSGSAVLPRGGHLWVLAHRRGLGGWWPQGGGAAQVENGQWTVFAFYGIAGELGIYEIAVVVVDAEADANLRKWVHEAPPSYSPTGFPNTMEECPVRRIVVQRVGN